ncbi:unnamed protein product [Pleuronectes platessa]|uniref:Uncharacterized protein n=1 Tax=Pleuronectes platessa TaxID=8262 RepID=A0A9N7VEC4_PLEPL|nr:unnamed protein product [Pleuronectes platessa]
MAPAEEIQSGPETLRSRAWTQSTGSVSGVSPGGICSTGSAPCPVSLHSCVFGAASTRVNRVCRDAAESMNCDERRRMCTAAVSDQQLGQEDKVGTEFAAKYLLQPEFKNKEKRNNCTFSDSEQDYATTSGSITRKLETAAPRQEIVARISGRPMAPVEEEEEEEGAGRCTAASLSPRHRVLAAAQRQTDKDSRMLHVNWQWAAQRQMLRPGEKQDREEKEEQRPELRTLACLSSLNVTAAVVLLCCYLCSLQWLSEKKLQWNHQRLSEELK